MLWQRPTSSKVEQEITKRWLCQSYIPYTMYKNDSAWNATTKIVLSVRLGSGGTKN